MQDFCGVICWADDDIVIVNDDIVDIDIEFDVVDDGKFFHAILCCHSFISSLECAHKHSTPYRQAIPDATRGQNEKVLWRCGGGRNLKIFACFFTKNCNYLMLHR